MTVLKTLAMSLCLSLLLAVTAPSSASADYRVVAAGMFTASGAASGPVHNQLRATRLSLPGHPQYELTFAGYQKPARTHTYIVKGSAQGDGTIQVVSFTNTAIRIRLVPVNGGTPTHFAVEVSAVTGGTVKR